MIEKRGIGKKESATWYFLDVLSYELWLPRRNLFKRLIFQPIVVWKSFDNRANVTCIIFYCVIVILCFLYICWTQWNKKKSFSSWIWHDYPWIIFRPFRNYSSLTSTAYKSPARVLKINRLFPHMNRCVFLMYVRKLYTTIRWIF